MEHFQDYVFNTAKYLNIKIDESYALPTTTTKIMEYDQNIKLQPQDQLTRFYRVVSFRDLDTTELTLMITKVTEAIPESVEVEIQEHDMTNHNRRYKERSDIAAQQASLRELQKLR